MIAAREVTPQAMINRHLISPWSLDGGGLTLQSGSVTRSCH